MKKMLVLILAIFVFACSGTSNLNQSQYESLKSTNYLEMITSIESENLGTGTYYYIDGSFDKDTEINNVKLFCKEKNSKFAEEYNGTFNYRNFSFTLSLTKGEYILTIELTDIDGNKYIQKNISLPVE